jgi:hypothetical protein
MHDLGDRESLKKHVVPMFDRTLANPGGLRRFVPQLLDQVIEKNRYSAIDLLLGRRPVGDSRRSVLAAENELLAIDVDEWAESDFRNDSEPMPGRDERMFSNGTRPNPQFQGFSTGNRHDTLE